MSTSTPDDGLPKVRGKRGRYHHGDLRQSLLDAGLVILSKQGIQALTLREVARRAGVSHAAPYRHFADQNALIASIAEQGFRRFTQMMKEAAEASGDDPVARLRAVGRSYVRFAMRHRDEFRVMFSPRLENRGQFPLLDEAGLESFQVLLDCIQACQDRQKVRPGDPRNWALAAWAAVHGVSLLILDGLPKSFVPPELDAQPGAFEDRLTDLVTLVLFEGLQPGFSTP